jgi:hypothetical protein
VEVTGPLAQGPDGSRPARPAGSVPDALGCFERGAQIILDGIAPAVCEVLRNKPNACIKIKLSG